MALSLKPLRGTDTQSWIAMAAFAVWIGACTLISLVAVHRSFSAARPAPALAIDVNSPAWKASHPADYDGFMRALCRQGLLTKEQSDAAIASNAKIDPRYRVYIFWRKDGTPVAWTPFLAGQTP